ncbi:GRAM domain-containing protein, partial [Linnemannia elongata]
MNGGSIQYEPYETDNNLPVTQAQGGSGPGSFPESYGADGQEYNYNGDAGYSQAGSTSSQNDGDDYSAANINFVYANEKRFSDFHSVFRSVPDEEKLIEDYGCALQKEILVQGRLYISENHVCFNANIFGWVTNLVIAFSEITAIEKRLTAFVIPNAISIVTTTNTKGHFFASFLSRDAAHDLLMAAWRNGRSASESAPNSLSIKTNGHAVANGSAPAAAASSSSADGGAPAGAGASHAPTTCKCSKDGRHYANSFLSETYPGTVESMWKLLFDSNFSKSFLTNEAMKGADVQEEAWKDAGDGTSTKVTKYTKWLGMPIGPKTTKAILTDVCEYKNFDDHVSTVTTTSTPDVPSGGSFTTKCRTCITWAGPNQVLVVVTGAVEFTKSSWIKGQIEKGAAEGMGTHYKELNSSIRKHI